MKPASRLALCLALLWAQTAAAHHSFDAEFDRNKPVTLTGSVTRVDWGNPHIWVFMDVKDETGKVSNWGVEGGAPNALFRNGWRKDTLKIGETVKVTGNRAKNPESKNIGQATILNEAGKRVYAGNAAGGNNNP